MTIVPRSRAPFHIPTPPFAGRRWPSRFYSGDLAQASWVRGDLVADLSRLEGLCPQVSDDAVLCVGEMFANACAHSRSGEPGGRVMRTLFQPTADTVRLCLVDGGTRTDAPALPRIPVERTCVEWALAESGRGLLLIESLALAWGSESAADFPFCAGQGTAVWADFALTGTPAPAGSQEEVR
ncbi:ATP-binding protein [Nocardiopsis algeriensis]|uniref:Anti-sigma regulatory factor (Ser/Thr protein kinase) n=1 Tax=Nocardiopsis algeriensis TaxID=1478215 RepID=A0A841IL28_9ACTN|nr:ATP-binding protein [Nocardiopsis algeriensis]MBB6119489.1 anti-sigma regulatory factor (Ser/Thr protein kinase) [Nocardiopsis algeriensis]